MIRPTLRIRCLRSAIALGVVLSVAGGTANAECVRYNDDALIRLALTDMFTEPGRDRIMDPLRAAFPSEVETAKTTGELVRFFRSEFPDCCEVKSMNADESAFVQLLAAVFTSGNQEISIYAVDLVPDREKKKKRRWKISYRYEYNRCGNFMHFVRQINYYDNKAQLIDR